MSRKKWTVDEELFLELEFGKYSTEALSKKMNRSIHSINSKASRMGLRAFDNQEWLVVSEFCTLTKISRTTVDYWIRTDGFPTTRIHKYRRIYPQRFWKWAEENKHKIDWVNFPEYGIGFEPSWVGIARTANGGKTTRRRNWTKSEISRLDFLLQQNKYTYPELSQIFDRSHGSIKRKIYDLNLPWPVYLARNPGGAKTYSTEELDKASDMYDAGSSLRKIAHDLGRSEAGLRGKMDRSGYRFERKTLVKMK